MTPTPTVADLLSQISPERAAEAQKGMKNLAVEPVQVGSRLYRFSSRAAGEAGWLNSPWWVSEICYQRILFAIGKGPADPASWSPAIIARIALALPHYWDESRQSPQNVIDLLVDATLLRPVWALSGEPRAQSETAPNGIRITWTGFRDVRQFFLPEVVKNPSPKNANESAFKIGGPSVSRLTLPPSSSLFHLNRTLTIPPHSLFQRS